ncbi:DUF4382 domain-containing protein [Chloroflexota bacterium]
MKIKIITGIAVMSILAPLLGACAPITSPDQTPSPIPTPSPASTPTPSPTPDPPPSLSGTLQVYVTDAPPREQVTSIMVTVSEVKVHIAQAEQEKEQEQEQSDSDNQTQEQEQEQNGEGKWITIDLSDDATTFDLLEIKGIEQYLGANEVTAGKYTQVRLVVDTIQVALGDGDLQDASVPSKELKIVRPFNVVAGETTALILDFEADKMVTVTGSGKIIVKPVVKLSIKQKGQPGKTQEADEEEIEELEFNGIIDDIDGTIWAMTIDGETKTVDVSNAEVDGEPAVGLEAEIKGTVVDDTIVASEAEVEETDEEEIEELEFNGIIDDIDGTIWTMTIDGETKTVDVSNAEVDGEPTVGLEAEIKGTVVDDTIVASEVGIEEG